MEDPKYTASVSIGGAENNTTDYETDCMGDRIHADQSFILQYTLTDGNDAGAFDIATATATLYVTAYKNAEFTPVSLAGGVLTDSGSGTTDRVTFTVAKDLIPDELAAFPLRTPGNAVFYAIISDADSKIEIVNFVNVYDDSYGLTSEAQPGANTIVPKGNDLGTVTDYTVTTPPTPTLNLAYIVAPSATGDWAGEDNNLAIGNGTSWIFFTVLDGNFAFDDNSDNQILFDGTNWSETSTQPFTDATALVKNDADNTKLIGFDASAITTATTRTITMPDTAVDLGDIATNTDKVTNATHTSEVTGATALTVASVAITNKTLVTAVGTDHVLISDASDSGNLKKALVSDFGGGSSLPVVDTTSIVEGSADATKEMRIEVDGLTTGTIRVATMPDADITLGTDADAIHDNIAGEIAAIANKVTAVNDDLILIEDSADSNNKKHVLASQFLAGSGDVSASAVLADNALIRGDGGAKGVQDSGILIDDSDNMTGVGNINDNGSGGVNNCIGSGAGAALTTGTHNTLIGAGAGDSITIGGYNLAIGSTALDSNISSSNNVAIGDDCLGLATSASNTAVGTNALKSLTTGGSNLAIGVSAGRRITGGVTANETSSNSMYLGFNTKASADGNSNETVIGYDATGNGSNTVTIGNSSVTDLFIGADNIQTLVAVGTDNNQTGTTYTLVLADEENKTVWMSNASANVLTIPTNASVAFAVGTKINVIMEAAGVTTITGDTGVTVNGTSAGSAVINNQYQGATLTKRSADVWIISGDVT